MALTEIGMLLSSLEFSFENGGSLIVTSPLTGREIAKVRSDTAEDLDRKISLCQRAQTAWAELLLETREVFLNDFSVVLRQNRETIAKILTFEAGKAPAEALGEVDNFADMLVKTIEQTTLLEFAGMRRRKERLPLGLIGLITSFNFPLAVAGWTSAPAFLAGNGVLWKPSEKTPLTALALKALFDQACTAYRDAFVNPDLLQILLGGREVGESMVADARVEMISATGSVGMGKAIERALAERRASPAILELGGNNAAIISEHTTQAHREYAVNALLLSILGSNGQRCTNTRRIIAHESIFKEIKELFTRAFEAFIASGAIKISWEDAPNTYGYGPLIDAEAFARFEHTKKQAQMEGGQVIFGKRLFADAQPDAYFVEPCLVCLPSQTPIMFEETFAPLVTLIPYAGAIDQAIALANAPRNAGLVNAIYTLSQKEADLFARENKAGHSLINPPKGTGTPAHGMGFGGCKDSGMGEILNTLDPLAPFTRKDSVSRVAQAVNIEMLE